VYNHEDGVQMIALASGAFESGANKDWDAPKNTSGLYTLIIKRDAGGGAILAAGSGTNADTFMFNGLSLEIKRTS
jgi:hypothetical protein